MRPLVVQSSISPRFLRREPQSERAHPQGGELCAGARRRLPPSRAQRERLAVSAF